MDHGTPDPNPPVLGLGQTDLYPLPFEISLQAKKGGFPRNSTDFQKEGKTCWNSIQIEKPQIQDAFLTCMPVSSGLMTFPPTSLGSKNILLHTTVDPRYLQGQHLLI